jgi:hypothetical protein
MSPRFGLDRDGRSEDRNEGEADKSSAAYWRGLKSGDFVGLSDTRAFEASLSVSGPGGSLDYEVGDIRRFALLGRPNDGGPALRGGRGSGKLDAKLGSYSFVELAKEGSGRLYLVLVDEPGLFELRLYFIPPEIPGGTRDEYVDRGDGWLFLPPPDPEDFLSKDLEYAPYPDVPPVDGRKIVFARSGPGPKYAEALDTGAPSAIVEYEAEASGEAAPANPLILLVEEGWMRSDGTEPEEGGFLTLMLGKRLDPGDIEHWPA